MLEITDITTSGAIDAAAQLWQALQESRRWWFVDWTESCCLDE